LAFIDERLFLTMNQPVLPLHECANPAAAESTTEHLHSIDESAAAAKSAAEALQSVADSVADCAAVGVALTKTS
jgi:hypothetical protein